ncbi:spore germination protein [Paenibacillus sp. NPDC058071]|uniref:spore germination protein n=1 Tax=Paenibacillus sp. NPDC058071 TaxID=3346326 RepID=UPI0036DD364B
MNNRTESAEKTEAIFPNEHILRKWFGHCNDILIHSTMFGQPPSGSHITFIYCSGMTDSKVLNDVIMPDLRDVYEKTKFVRKEEFIRASQVEWSSLDDISPNYDRDFVAARVFEGHLICCIPNLKTIYSVDIANFPVRTPSDSSSEVSIRGPRDGFVELVTTNVALIRKRLRTPTLACEYYIIGTRTMTKVAYLYIEDITNKSLTRLIRRKLKHIDIEALQTVNQLDELLVGHRLMLFPLTGYTGRPDFAVECLLNGRIIILVDGNPTCLIAPVNLFLLIKSPEDAHFSFLGVNVGRALRAAGLLLTIFLPGFYIALTSFHLDQIPFALLATISVGRIGLPMESGLEMFFIMCLMELFREAGVRLPSMIGQTLTVVGGLIIGDAAIRAGLVSPLMIVITAITIVAGSTLVNQVLTSSMIMMRFVSFLLSAFIGMYGLILSFIIFILYVTSLKSFGMPYLTPISPLNLKMAMHALFKLPFFWRKRRPESLHTQKPIRSGENG